MKKITTLVLVLAFGISLSAQEIGLQLYSLRNQFKTDVPGTLKLINDWGITNLEAVVLMALKWMNSRGY